MALNFPSSPSVGQVFTDSTSGNTYRWTGTYWKSYSTVNPATDFDVVNLNVSGVTSTRNLRVTGISTLGIVTASQLYISGVTTTGSLTVTGTSLFQGGIQANSIIIANGGVTGNLTGNLTGNVTSTGINTFGNVNVTGVITATSFVGSGSSLTGLPAGFNELDGMLFM